MISIGIIGGSGYTGGELIRLLLQHKKAQIDFIYSTTRAGKPITAVHADLYGITDLHFTGDVNTNVDLVFLCLGHGNSTKFLGEYKFANHTKIIDLSNDFRLQNNAILNGKKFVYGLPESNPEGIKEAAYIANPGCFATAIQLALLPLAKEGLLNKDVHINAVTGSTGAGVSTTATSHFSWRNNNVSWYKAFNHQHLGEIKERLTGFEQPIGNLFFLPNRGRGIFATAYLHFDGTEKLAQEIYSRFYANALFTQVVNDPIHLKQVTNTNYCHIHLHKYENTLLITSAIDNLLKGASGQAVQNMNLMFGYEEQEGLQLKATVF